MHICIDIKARPNRQESEHRPVHCRTVYMINDPQLKAGWQIWHSYDAVPKDNLSLTQTHRLSQCCLKTSAPTDLKCFKTGRQTAQLFTLLNNMYWCPSRQAVKYRQRGLHCCNFEKPTWKTKLQTDKTKQQNDAHI